MADEQKNEEEFEESFEHIEKEELNELLAKPSRELIQEILDYNDISFIFLSGVLSKGSTDKMLGFFRDVVSSTGKELFYPNGNQIDNIFIYNPKGIEEGERYYFQVKLAWIDERRKKRNPHLLQTTNQNVEKTEEIDNLAEAIEEKRKELDEVQKKRVEKEKEANKIIEEYNSTIIEKHSEISQKEKQGLELDAKINQAQNQLSNIINQKDEMTQIIDSLKHRLHLCRNLEFINEKDEKQYISVLSETPIEKEGHLNFENDLDNSFAQLTDHVHHYLYKKKHLVYTKFQIRNFLSLLKTNDLVVLSGLSGSGKTQIVKAFADALGGVAKIIPVKPNWTSSEDLIGYYNPIQQSFLPTPFTEAIVEAIHNPHQLYLICLDEMNLARVEYYFADFLSKLEERTKEPEIELYSKHEEELFVSEFNTLLNFIESSIKGIEIKSWQDFIENKEARNQFFEMLGNADKESLLQLHVKMKRRLIDILKFPATIKIPNNVRFIGAINVDETTHYFSPKILDRVHIVKFENPLLFEEEVKEYFELTEYDKELKPVYISPGVFSQRKEYPNMNDIQYSFLLNNLKEINRTFLLPLNIDFGIRSIRQSLNYSDELSSSFESRFDHREDEVTTDEIEAEILYQQTVSLNSIIIQKILPRFLFDSSEIVKNGDSKLDTIKEMQAHIEKLIESYYISSGIKKDEIGEASSKFLSEMIQQAEHNPQINFFA